MKCRTQKESAWHFWRRFLVGAPPAGAQDYHPVKGSYAIYSQELGDMAAPTQHDAELALSLEGPLAKDLFTRLGAAATLREECSTGIVTRTRGALSCTRTVSTGEVDCSLGFDIVKGKAIPGSIC
jgi:hypothetical protein